jgi:HAD domain in Swiss Army Knife RNA repair proteins
MHDSSINKRYIFLDIDGVMKPGRAYFCEKNSEAVDAGFDPLAVAAINLLCKKTGAAVVFNTTWNRQNIMDIAEAQGLTAPIAGKTKYPYLTDRLMAIRHWLEDNKQQDSEWVALDDCKIDHERAIAVCPENGISTQNYRDACRLLGTPDAFMLLL